MIIEAKNRSVIVIDIRKKTFYYLPFFNPTHNVMSALVYFAYSKVITDSNQKPACTNGALLVLSNYSSIFTYKLFRPSNYEQTRCIFPWFF
jgi:hypothetical protein